MSITSGASGSGAGTVNVSVSANAGNAERTGTLSVAGQSVAVREDGTLACTIEISPSQAAFGKDAATGTFAVAAPAQCSWTAESRASWLAVTTGGSGTGNGTVAYAVERNRDIAGRSAAVVVGERRFEVTQTGDTGACEYSVTPVTFSPCMSAPSSFTVSVTTRPECTWTASPNASWIALTGGASGAGPGTVTFSISQNWDAPRQGAVMLRWPSATAGQNVWIYQAGCRYAVSVSVVNVAAAGGPARFDVLQQSEPLTCGGPLQNACLWQAEPDVPWITVTTSMPQVGDNPVAFTVAPNDSTASRAGNIRVRDKVVQVVQAGR
jgi:hypothetical protein